MSDRNDQKKQGRKIDGFFLGCMAGVAAVSVAATLVIGGMVGGEKAPADEKLYSGAIVPTGESMVTILEQQAEELKLENSELQEQIELQRQQIQDLRAQLLDLTGETQPGQTDEQAEAYDIFRQIQAAYDDFDRETLEQLIPEMDKRLEYLSNDALYEYYQILEYVEQPSNG